MFDFWESIQLLFRPTKKGAGRGPANTGAGTKSASAAGAAPKSLTGRLAGPDRFETPSFDSDPAELYLFEDKESTIAATEK